MLSLAIHRNDKKLFDYLITNKIYNSTEFYFYVYGGFGGTFFKDKPFGTLVDIIKSNSIKNEEYYLKVLSQNNFVEITALKYSDINNCYSATVSVNNLRIRSHPALNGKIVSLLKKGDKVKILATVPSSEKINGIENNWRFVVNENNEKGWIFGGYLLYQ